MAALNATMPTLWDLAKALDPDGNTADIVEILNQTNEVLDDAVWLPGNETTGHQVNIRAGIPASTWTKLGQGIQANKSTLTAVHFNTARQEGMSEVDDRLLDLANDPKGYRLQEDAAHLEGFSQALATKLFYGNDQLTPEEFTGFSAYYSTRVTANAQSAYNVIHGGSSDTDNGSIWLIGWSPTKIHCIVPKNTMAGIQTEDFGRQVIEDVTGSQVGGTNGGGRMVVWRTLYRQYAGLVVRDWRYAVRIANIDKSNLTKDAATGADLSDLMFQALRKIPSLSACRPVFYMSRDMATMLARQQANLVKNSTLTTDFVGGKVVDFFNKIPVRRVDVLAADEALVV